MNRREYDRCERPKMLAKKADVQDWLNRAHAYVGEHPEVLPLGLAAAGAGASAIKGHMDSRVLSQAQEKSVAHAMQLFPELQHHDPQKVKMLVATMHQLAPHVATNPQILGTFLKAQLASTDLHVSPLDLKGYQDLEQGMLGRPAPQGQHQDLSDTLAHKMNTHSTLLNAAGLGRTMENQRRGREGGGHE